MRKAKFLKALSLAMEPDMFDHIKKISDEEGISMAKVIRIILRDVFGFKLPGYTIEDMCKKKGYQENVKKEIEFKPDFETKKK